MLSLVSIYSGKPSQSILPTGGFKVLNISIANISFGRSIPVIIKVHSLSSGKVASTPILKSVPSQLFGFYSLNYGFAARLQDNSRPKSSTKVETKRKLQQFTVSGWLVMNGGESGSEKKKTLRLKSYEVSVELPLNLCLHESLFS